MTKHTGWALKSPQGKLEYYAQNPHGKSKVIELVAKDFGGKRENAIAKLRRSGFRMVRALVMGPMMVEVES